MKRMMLWALLIGVVLAGGVSLLNAQNTESGSARVRIAHAWRSLDENVSAMVDIYINDTLVGKSMDTADATSYQLVNVGSVRITLYLPGAVPGQDTPLLSALINAEASQSYTVLLAGGEDNNQVFIPINDNIQPLPTGTSRLTIVQANPFMLDSNLILPDVERALAYNLTAGDIIGTIDLPANTYTIEIYDAENPIQILTTLSTVEMASTVNQLMVFVPSPPQTGEFTDVLFFRSSTRRAETDVSVQFVNATSRTGRISLLTDGFSQIRALDIGDITVQLPIPAAGSTLVLQNSAEDSLYNQLIGPWSQEQQPYNSVALIYEADVQNTNQLDVFVKLFLQNPRPAPARSTLRLIHGLADTVPLTLQLRSHAEGSADQSTPVPGQEWITLGGSARFSETSDYAVTTPGIYDIRVVLAGSQNVIAQQDNVILQPGGVYDFVVVAGSIPGEVILRTVLPEPLPGGALTNSGDPAVIRDIVDATLTALVPETSITATRTPTPMPTFSPVPTNTPRPSNTPGVKPPSIIVDPAPPNAVRGGFLLYGEGFTGARGFTVDIGDQREVSISQVGDDGTLVISVEVPASLSPGVYPVRVCADCRPGGAQEEAFAVIRIGSPDSTPTATAQP